MNNAFKKLDSKPSMDMALIPTAQAIDIGLGASDKGNTVPSVKPKKKSMTSFFLRFFETAADGKSRRCKFCKQSYSIATATGNLGRHLNNRHPGYDQQGDSVGPAILAPSSSKKAQLPTKQPSLDLDHLNWLLLKWLIGGSLSPSAFEDAGLIDAFKFLSSSVKFWSKAKAQSVIVDAFKSMREDVRMFLRQVSSKISITLDFWASYEKVPYMSVTGSWIDENWCAQKVLLDVVHIPYPHGGLEIYHSLFKILEMFDINSRILACTYDNNQNAIIACRMLKDYLDDLKMPFTHIPCGAHTLNLIIEDGLRSVKATISKVRECVIEMNASPEIAQDFCELASSCQEGSWKFPLDASVRWTGHYMMLDVAAKAHTAMDAVIMKNEKILGRNQMTSAEKMAVDRTQRYLEPFYKTTNNLCASKFPTIGLVLFFMDNVVEMISTCRDSRYDQEWLKAAAVDMGNKALKYSSQVYNLYTYISAILDPRIKGELVPMDLNSERNLEAARNLFVMNYSSGHFTTISNGYGSQENEEAGNSVVSFAEEIARKRRRVSMSSATDELTQYLSEPPVPMPTDILDWWKVNSTRYPRLAVMARDYLAIQPTSVPPENLFSTVGDTEDKQRLCLSHDNAQVILCVRSWMKSGFKIRAGQLD
ncbi:putative AC transposase [Nymphaea colorata]|nr:putative AC transposase [Nymphaea colorata]